MHNREKVRGSHKPATVKLLFIAESPPAGGTFFYNDNSNLSRYTKEAFSRAYDIDFGDNESFLDYFKNLGCYLEDLCLEPVNNIKSAKERNAKCKESIPSLAGRIQGRNPSAIIIVKRSIVKFALQAIDIAGLSIPKNHIYSLKFPTFGHQWRYVDGLSAALKELRASGVM